MGLSLSSTACLNILYAAICAFGFSIFFNLRGKKLLICSLGGGFSWMFYELFAAYGVMPQFFAAGAAIALYAELMARIMKAPGSIYIAPALIPLVPGGALYRSMLHALNGENDLFISTGIDALMIIGALTLGIVSVSSVARLLFVNKLRNPYSHIIPGDDGIDLNLTQF